MALALAVISFLFAVLIGAFAPVKRVRASTPHIAVIWWFVAVNLIHGVNAVLWHENINIHIPAWCDIMTNIELGARIGIPGAFCCIAMELELVSSSRPILTSAIVKRNRQIFEALMCFLVPILYMLSHFIVQDHRFDIVRDLGCFASSHPSTPGFVIPWVPPVFLCLFALAFSAVSFHHAKLDRIESLHTYLKSRDSSLSDSLFLRRLGICMVVPTTFVIISFGLLFSIPNYSSWTSWDFSHKDIGIIEIVQPPAVVDPLVPQAKLATILITWWGWFMNSLLYIIMSLVIGEESRDARKWILQQFEKKKTAPRQLVLPLHNDDTSSVHKVPGSPAFCTPSLNTSVNSMNKPQLTPLNIELKSGWDDDEVPSKGRSILGSIRRAPSKASMSSCASPTSSSRPITPSHPPSPPCKSPTQAEDEQFMVSTLSYLSSPTARTLGLSPTELTPLRIPQPVFSPNPTRAFDVPSTPITPGQALTQALLPASAQTPTTPSGPRMPGKSILKSTPPRAAVPEDISGSLTITSVFDAAWPLPPESPAPSLVPSRHGSPTRSLSSARSHSHSSSHAHRSHSSQSTRSPSHSPSSSVEEILQVGYALYPTSTHPHAPHPHRRSGRPFEGSSVSSLVDITVPTPIVTVGPVPQSRIGSGLTRPIRSLRRNWSREHMRTASPAGSEVIRMTVVQETVHEMV